MNRPVGVTRKHVTDILEKYLEPVFTGNSVKLQISNPDNYEKLIEEIIFVANASNILEG